MSFLDKKRYFWLWLGLVILAYILPWVINTPTGLRMGGYDFAEWLSKVQFSVVELRVFLLRGQLFLIVAALAISLNRPFFTANWWGSVLLGLLLVLAQLPALNILPSVVNDPKPRQQVILAMMSLVVLSIGATGILWRFRLTLRIVLAVLVIISAVYGLNEAMNLSREYGLEAGLGFGSIFYILLWLLFGLVAVYKLYVTTRNKTGLPE